MNNGNLPPPILPEAAPVPEKTLHRLFLLLFLRGRGTRGLNRRGAPKSIGQKLALTLLIYGLFGCLALNFIHQPVFALAVYLHAMTLAFLGMFIASSAGEILFNREEADILMHRPIDPKIMLWAKIRVLVEVSLWLAGAFNLAGLIAGTAASGNWIFPAVHVFSTTLEALFCTGGVVLLYQLCLRWFGRDRLDGLMTTAQVLLTIAMIAGAQILPRMVIQFNRVVTVGELPWWVNALPPAWFAGLDDAAAGSRLPEAWVLAALAISVTTIVLWLAFGRLAQNYELGLQSLNETVSTRQPKPGGRLWLAALVEAPPLNWWMRDPVSRGSFLLTAAYLFRDRDVKLRVYPGLAPILVMPFIFLLQSQHGRSTDPGIGIPFSGIYLGMVPLLGLRILQYSQQWQAADIFRIAPLAGPAAVCHGARRAVLFILALPMLLLIGLIVWVMRGDPSQLLLLLPGIIALPVFALVPGFIGHGVPLSQPPDAAKAANRSFVMVIVMIPAFALAGAAAYAWSHGFFWWLILGEGFVAAALYAGLRMMLARARWPANE